MSGSEGDARAEYVRAYDRARAAGDVDAMAEAALGLAGSQIFGTQPGRVPAFLHEAYQNSAGPQRIRLAAALARAWAYGGSPERAAPFAAEAVIGAEADGDPALLADALDAELLVNWGPDDFDARLRITGRLEDVVSHVADVEARMTASLWRLTTALECLDPVAVQRQLRALEQLVADSDAPRVRFFVASRQAMAALLAGDPERAEALRVEAVRAGRAAGEADAYAIEHALAGSIARQRGDRDAMRREAEVFDAFGNHEGVISVSAEAALLWAEGGATDRARAVIDRLAGHGLAHIARDQDWLLSVVSLTDAASRVGLRAVVEEGRELLVPYAGRGVVNGGAVGFVGVVDGYLAAACDALGEPEEARRWAATAAGSYQRIGAVWWLDRLGHRPPPTQQMVAVLRRSGDGVWQIGTGDAPPVLREMKGFGYLRELVRRPGVEISALDLSGAVVEHAADDVIDRQALAAYRTRLAELDAELDEARDWADDGRAARAEHEREALLAEIGAATGLGGRVRRTGSSAERARVAVRKAVAAAIDRIAEHDAALGRLLNDCIETGYACRYRPDPARPVTWRLD